MPEDSIAQGEIAALTRRYENNLQIIRGDIASVDNRLADFERDTGESLSSLREELKAMREEQQKANAQIIELLSGLIGRTP